MKSLENKPLFTTAELSVMLGVSKVTVHKRIKAKKIVAQMMGGSYLISRDEVNRILNVDITPEDREKIRKAVEKTIEEYGDVLKMLAKE